MGSTTIEEDDDMLVDEDSDSFSWNPSVPSANSSSPLHRRARSANEVPSKNTKRGHTVVERSKFIFATFRIPDLLVAILAFSTVNSHSLKRLGFTY